MYQVLARQKGRIAARIKNGWRYPLLRFICLGLVLWLGNAYIERRQSYVIETPTKEQLEISYQDWARRTGHFPNEQQRAELLRTELEDRALFAEAVRQKLYLDDPVVYQRLLKNAEFLGIQGDDAEKIDTALNLRLHLNDELIRRHLIEKLKTRIRARIYPLPSPSNQLLHARYLDSRERWKVAPSIELEQVFFSADDSDIGERLLKAKERLSEQSLTDQQAYALGEKFLLGNRLSPMDLPKLRNIFGAGFTRSLQAALKSGLVSADRPAWFGPIESAYGFHFIKILAYEGLGYRDFDEVRETLIGDYDRELEARELKKYVADLLHQYTVGESSK